MIVQRPVSTSLARAFFYIMLLSLLSTGVALLTLASSLRDAEAVNIAGSLRMQSYRLGYELQANDPQLENHRQQYATALNSPVLLLLNRWYVPKEVRERYTALHDNWHEMNERLLARDLPWYQHNISGYVRQIDLFVLALQHYAERKMIIVVLTSLFGFMAIFTLVFFTLRRIRQQVVEPLNKLVRASRSIEQQQFDYPPLNTELDNELGLLGRSFTRMSGELQKLYRSLEENVREKTLSLQEANRMLGVLYHCSQALNVSTIDQHCFRRILQIIRQHESIGAIEMEVGSHWRLSEGTSELMSPWHTLPLAMQETTFGQLRWQAQGKNPSPQLMESVANMLGRGLFFNQAQKHYQQLLLMEERATIARELHDSLAQVLSFLRIQLTLLKRAVPLDNAKAQQIISDFDRALNDAYRQLRELLTTFRLTLQQADLPSALQEMIEPLRGQTSAAIHLDCKMSPLALDAQQQVHLLQIVREAVLNAIKHANASEISISCLTSPDGSHAVYIRDNGAGIASLDEPAGHYGLNIMHERAERLGGVLTISRPVNGGTMIGISFTTPQAMSDVENV
ncbi:nitrate/nitrite two-component system sensor histidine kinase NarQ [Atlantibacter hermannii]|uniref:nitrate/nitrite two-component system sensor histidine kinase NarQ n=1 Tax=Atlantibacter hermannii TaxID=565 RepID=UPI0028AC6BDF|nr:nitrate/nitrite two-component system sensor histidine kinase NarQ [Atlantibacter hermannii]